MSSLPTHVLDNEKLYTFRAKCAGAEQVFLIGDFNNWSTTAIPMMRTEPEVWQVSMRLPPGQYRFSYFVINNGFMQQPEERALQDSPQPLPPTPMRLEGGGMLEVPLN